MGYVLEITCSHCDYKKRFELGQGMKDCRLERVLPRFSSKICEEIHAAFNHPTDSGMKRGVLWNYEKQLGYCSKCIAYQAVPVMQVMDGDKRYIFADGCTCGEEYEIYSGDIEDILSQLHCPVCGEELNGEVKGYWD